MNWKIWWTKFGSNAGMGLIAMLVTNYLPASVEKAIPGGSTALSGAIFIGLIQLVNFVKHTISKKG